MKQTRGYRNNNPGNIRINSDVFEGEVKPSKDKSFKQFKSMAYGYRAMFVILRTYIQKYNLNTIRSIISRYAPPSENATDAYIKAVSDYSGIDPDEPVHADDRIAMIAIVAGMSRVENGIPSVMKDVLDGFNLL